MYRSDGSQGYRTPRSRASHVQDSFERLTGEQAFSTFDAGRQFESGQAPKSYTRLRPDSRYLWGTDSGYASSVHSARSSKISSTTYTSAGERPSVKATTTEAVRRDREEQKIKAQEGGTESASQLGRERPLPLLECSPLVGEEPWHQHPKGTSASASRRSTRSIWTISDLDIHRQHQADIVEPSRLVPAVLTRRIRFSKQAPPARTANRTKSTGNHKGSTFITRDAHGNLRSERCLNGKCRAKCDKNPSAMASEKHTSGEYRTFLPR